MKCKKCQEMISLYMDDALTSEEKKQFDGHIAKCSVCQEELEFMQKLMMHVHDLDDEKELPSDFHGNLMDKIDRIQESNKVTPMKKLNNIRKYYSALAAVFVAVLIFGIIGIANLDKFGNLSMKSENSSPMVYGEATMDQSESDSIEKNTAKHDSEAEVSNEPREQATQDKETDEKVENSVEQFIADKPMSDDESESLSPDGDMTNDEFAGTRTSDNSNEMDSAKSNSSDWSRGEEVEALKPRNIVVEKNHDESETDVANIEMNGIDKESITITFDSDGKLGKHEGTNYSISKDNATSKPITTKEDHSEEKQNNKQTYFIIIIFGLIIFVVGILTIIRKKRR